VLSVIGAYGACALMGLFTEHARCWGLLSDMQVLHPCDSQHNAEQNPVALNWWYFQVGIALALHNHHGLR